MGSVINGNRTGRHEHALAAPPLQQSFGFQFPVGARDCHRIDGMSNSNISHRRDFLPMRQSTAGNQTAQPLGNQTAQLLGNLTIDRLDGAG